ncbi:uncharacterized protein At1g32220, chloroplastic-like isoform X1 [Elaeis guineensis]|uniref:uncharacterized protein At1g32220, chloroplastic-like isoform X1 n=1 Tax=Elaeis guineensis var. tenera TaxID=51953 RepID=UPI003C6D29E9
MQNLEHWRNILRVMLILESQLSSKELIPSSPLPLSIAECHETLHIGFSTNSSKPKSPIFLLILGYFTGKRKAESEVSVKYANSGESLQRLLLAAENFIKPLNLPPASDLLLAAPLSVDDIAHAVINAVTDNHFFGIFTIKRSK